MYGVSVKVKCKTVGVNIILNRVLKKDLLDKMIFELRFE